jgi:AAA+ ATPase superfamily predicted ATPase
MKGPDSFTRYNDTIYTTEWSETFSIPSFKQIISKSDIGQLTASCFGYKLTNIGRATQTITIQTQTVCDGSHIAYIGYSSADTTTSITFTLSSQESKNIYYIRLSIGDSTNAVVINSTASPYVAITNLNWDLRTTGDIYQ